MQKNIGTFDRATRLSLGIFALVGAAILFTDPVARLFALAFGVYAVWECAAGKCPLHAALGGLAPSDVLDDGRVRLLGLTAVQAVLAYEWWAAGWTYVTNKNFLDGVAGTIGYFASLNPYPWYKAFLLGPATAMAGLLGRAVELGELAAGLALAIAAAVILLSKSRMAIDSGYRSSIAALAVGMFMNANFYLAAGWTSASAKGHNAVMFWTSAALLYVWAASLRKAAGGAAQKA